MTTDWSPVEGRITLHGLGFVVVQLSPRERMHVWHPDLPRRRCFEDSQVHDHRFGFTSRVLVGELTNVVWERDARGPSTHDVYLHAGERGPDGNRPWLKQPKATRLWQVEATRVSAGQSYAMQAYAPHHTAVAGDGVAVTLMTKTSEGTAGARSFVRKDAEPDTSFDRYQLKPHRLWGYVVEALGWGSWGEGLRPFVAEVLRVRD